MRRTSPSYRLRLGLPTLVAAALLVMSAVVPGLALAQGPGTAAGFEIDGNLRCGDVITGVTSGEDWFRNESGFRVNNGVYFIHSTIGGQRKTVSVVYLK